VDNQRAKGGVAADGVTTDENGFNGHLPSRICPFNPMKSVVIWDGAWGCRATREKLVRVIGESE
jgi:hypothetical protein